MYTSMTANRFQNLKFIYHATFVSQSANWEGEGQEDFSHNLEAPFQIS